MSVFDTGDSQTSTVADPENTQTLAQPQESFVRKLVEARGEQWSNPETIAKGKLEADSHITQLEAQLEEFRQKLGEQDYSKTLLERLEAQAAATTTANPQVQPNNNIGGTNTEGNTQPAVSEEVLKSLMEQTLTAREATRTAADNIAVVNKHLEDAFGTEAKAHIDKKAKELGMTVERMQTLASESPNAFLHLIGEQQRVTQPIVSGSIRTEGVNMQSSTERDWKYYSSLRKKDKHQYYSASVQSQMLADKRRMGDKFGNP